MLTHYYKKEKQIIYPIKAIKLFFYFFSLFWKFFYTACKFFKETSKIGAEWVSAPLEI